MLCQHDSLQFLFSVLACQVHSTIRLVLFTAKTIKRRLQQAVPIIELRVRDGCVHFAAFVLFSSQNETVDFKQPLTPAI